MGLGQEKHAGFWFLKVTQTELQHILALVEESFRLNTLNIGNVYLKHDNDPTHTAKSTKKGLRDKSVNVPQWSSHQWCLKTWSLRSYAKKIGKKHFFGLNNNNYSLPFFTFPLRWCLKFELPCLVLIRTANSWIKKGNLWESRNSEDHKSNQCFFFT